MNIPVRNILTGRTTELAVLRRLVADTGEGRGGLLFVWGQPGTGKTALLNAALTSAAEHGCAVLRGAGDELTTPFPLLPVTAALDVEPGGADTEGLLALVRERCAAAPVVLALEDLQWADEPTLLLWNRLARAVATESLPLLLIGTARPWPRQETLGVLTDLVTRRAGRVVELGPLGETDVATLAGQLIGAPPGPRLRAMLDTAGGNPLYVRRMADALLADGPLNIEHGIAEPPDQPGDDANLPAVVTAALGESLSFLPSRLRAALRVAALLGTRFCAAEWAEAAGHNVPEITVLTGGGIEAGILSGDGDRLRFRHEIVRQALAAEIPAALHAASHAEIARLLARAAYPAREVARHLLAGPADLAPWVTAWLAGRPDADLYTAPGAFAELLARAVGTVPEEGEVWEALNVRSGKVLFWQGRDDEALTAAVAVAARTGDPAMLVLAVRAALRLGQPQHALQLAAQYPLFPERTVPLWYARLTAWLAHAVYRVAGAESGETLAKEALDLATASGDPLTIGYARYALAACGDVAAEASRLREALSVLPGRDPESTEMRVLLSASHLRAVLRQGVPAAEADATRAAAIAAGEQAGWDHACAIRATAAWFCYLHGRWDEALAHLAGTSGSFTAGARGGIGALIALRRGDRPAADACLAGVPLRDGTDGSSHALTRALALHAEADGDLAAAVAMMRRSLGWPSASRTYDELPYLVHLALLAGDVDSARDASDMAAADVAGEASPGRCATARFCTALLGDDVPGLLSVAGAYMSFGWVPAAAMAHEEAAARLAAAGDAAGARAALTDAVRCYTNSKATWDVRRADARLRVYGVRRGPRSAHKHASTGWASLTPAELRIVSLVGQGISNADIAAELFLSRRTVHTHVSHILHKLGASSRIDLVREAARHEP
jgi:DNA-binding CsgD family transcriptional regulator